ncbi:MAG: riboflavin biosynthesis protein RibF [Flavobacteriaceae bacterium]|nr:riboflavin biosynthesis protein RibF [Flavobacteriaceae bacterium]|tara:strand:+ start:5346 stop:6290 length:945 start_codon:yes stop_codon:yes gene_type:complete
MKVFHGIENYSSKNKCFLTIGTFDGVHVGHQEIIRKLVYEAHCNNSIAIVLTFFPHPRSVIQKDENVKLIDTMDEKKHLLKKLNVDALIIEPFTIDFSNLSAINFARDILVKKINISKLFIGYDHRFGKNRTASVSELISYGDTYGFEVCVIPAQNINSVSVSSTKIRKGLSEGKISLVNNYLGRKYMLEGKVIHDQGLGKKIGFPTANLEIISKNKAIPRMGVYFVSMLWKNKCVFGMLNIGNRPTVKSKKESIEVHFFDFNQNLYNLKIKLNFINKIREEKNFKSIESLKKQLIKDREFCLKQKHHLNIIKE